MIKPVRILLKILIAGAIICAIYFILTINAIDIRLSRLINPSEDTQKPLIYSEFSNEKYEAADTGRPCLFMKDGRLMIAAGANICDVTPSDINMAYYGPITDLNGALEYKKNCIVRGRYIIYRLEFNEIPYLYYYDTVKNAAYCITDRVDSFAVFEDNESDRLTLIYATGYEQSNKLLVYRSDEEEGAGKSELIAENISEAGLFEAYGYVLYLMPDGKLYRYEPGTGISGILSEGIETVYFPGSQKYNYDKYYEDFTVCCRKNGVDKLINGVSEAEIEGGFYSAIPEFTYRFKDGGNTNIIYYTKNSGRLFMAGEESHREMYPEIGEIYNIFGYTGGTEKTDNADKEPAYIIAASADSLYLLKSDGREAVRLMKLPMMYRRHEGMLEKHMRVYEMKGVLYVSMLTEGSLVINPKNTDSWMNAISSYNYGLTALVRSGSGYEVRKLDVASSRHMSAPAPLALSDPEGYMTYSSYFADGSVKSVSLICGGEILSADIFTTSGLSEKQCSINVLPCDAGTYFSVKYAERNSGAEKRGFYYLKENSVVLEPVYENGRLITEIYDDFTAESSFGTLVIFSKERYN